MLELVPYLSKLFVLLILSGLFAASGAGFSAPALAQNQDAVGKMFGEFDGQAFRNSFFSQHGRPDQPGDDELEYEELSKRRLERQERKEADEINEEKDKLKRQARLKAISDGDSLLLDHKYVTPLFEKDFRIRVLPPDLFSDDRPQSVFGFAQLDSHDDDDSDKGDTLDDWKKVRRASPGLFPRARELDERDDLKRRDLAKLAGPVREVTGDWVPSKLDPLSNGGFTIAPDNGSPVPYKLNGHVDIQRGRPWNDND